MLSRFEQFAIAVAAAKEAMRVAMLKFEARLALLLGPVVLLATIYYNTYTDHASPSTTGNQHYGGRISPKAFGYKYAFG